MDIKEFAEPSVNEEEKIEDLTVSLYQRIMEETEKFLKSQLEKIGVDVPEAISKKELPGLKKIIYPDDPNAFASYEYNGVTILAVRRISDNGIGIIFDVPELETLETLNEREVQDV